MFSLRLMGGVGIEGPDGPFEGGMARRQRLTLLAYLALEGTKGVSRERVIALFWPESPSARARHALSNDLYAIRTGLGESVVLSRGDDLEFTPDTVVTDVSRFEGALAASDYESAATLYTGPFMDAVPMKSNDLERWVDGHRGRLARLYSTALGNLAERATEGADWDQAIHWWSAAAGVQPTNAQVTMGLMRALFGAGDIAGALRQARTHAQLRASDLDLPPDEGVEALANELRSGSPPAAVATPRTTAPASRLSSKHLRFRGSTRPQPT